MKGCVIWNIYSEIAYLKFFKVLERLNKIKKILDSCSIKKFKFYNKHSNSKNEYIVMMIAKHHSTPISIIEKLFYKNKCLKSIALNPNCPIYILEKLSNNSKKLIRSAVIQNINCPTHILEKLSKDKSFYVKTSVVGNKKCPISILDELSCNSSIDISFYIISNKNCTYDILKKLYKRFSDNNYFKKIIIEHTNWKLKEII